MRLILLLVFVILPLVELYLLLVVTWLTASVLWTMLLVVVTGVLGCLLTRSQGLRTYHRIQEELSAGKVPTDALLDGMLIFLAGAFLLTPGILTDLTGFTLLIPWSRRFYRRLILGWFKSRFSWQQVVGRHFSSVTFPASELDEMKDVTGSTVEGTVVDVNGAVDEASADNSDDAID